MRVDRQAARDEPGDDPGRRRRHHCGDQRLGRAHRVAQAADAARPERRRGDEVVVARHGEHRAPGLLDGVVGAHPAQRRAGGDPWRHQVRAGAQHLERGLVQGLVVDVPQGGAAQHRALGEPPGAQPVADQLGKAQPLQPAQVQPGVVAPPQQLEEGGDRADRKTRAGRKHRGERGVEGRRLAPPTGVVPGEQAGDRVPGGVDEGAGLGDRAEPDRPHLHVAGDPHEVGQQPVDGGDGIDRVALAPLRARPLPRRRERGPGHHPAGAVQRHRLGHGGAEIDADVDGRGHVLRNLGTPGHIGQRPSPAAAAISVPGRRACIVPGRRTASPGPAVHHSSGWRNWQTR